MCGSKQRSVNGMRKRQQTLKPYKERHMQLPSAVRWKNDKIVKSLRQSQKKSGSSVSREMEATKDQRGCEKTPHTSWANPVGETRWSEELTEMERLSDGAESVWLCTAKTGTKNYESMKVREIGHERRWKDVQKRIIRLEQGRVLAKNAKSMEN